MREGGGWKHYPCSWLTGICSASRCRSSKLAFHFFFLNRFRRGRSCWQEGGSWCGKGSCQLGANVRKGRCGGSDWFHGVHPSAQMSKSVARGWYPLPVDQELLLLLNLTGVFSPVCGQSVAGRGAGQKRSFGRLGEQTGQTQG